MSKFARDWEEGGKGIKSVLRPRIPLKQKIELATRRIEAQIQYMDGTLNRLTERDKVLFSKVVDAYTKHDTQRANVFANELAELRKMASFMINSKLALERVVLRLRTVSELGNVAVTLAPAAKILLNIRTGVVGVLPHAEQELGDIGTMLNEIIIEAGISEGVTPDFEVASEDAMKILNEAAMVAEQKVKEKFPELPALRAEHIGQSESANY